MTPTERTPICIETGNKYRLYFTELCGQPAAYYLIPETGNQSPKVKQFYLSTFDQQIKLNTGKIITLKPHTFYNGRVLAKKRIYTTKADTKHYT